MEKLHALGWNICVWAGAIVGILILCDYIEKFSSKNMYSQHRNG